MNGHVDEGDTAGDASTLEFGREFDQDVQCLTNAEVAVVLERHRLTNANKESAPTSAFVTTLAHAKRFSNTSDREGNIAATAELRHSLESFEVTYLERLSGDIAIPGKSALHQFEIAQLANLMLADTAPEEAVALIPSLARFEPEDQERVLDIVRSHIAS